MQMPMACGRFSVRALRRFTILSPFQIEEVPEHVFAPEVAAASDHSSVEINCEIHPGLMTDGVEGPRLARVSLNRRGALGSRKTLCALCLRLL